MISVLQEQLAASRNEQGMIKDELLKVKEENAFLRDSLRSTQQVSNICTLLSSLVRNFKGQCISIE